MTDAQASVILAVASLQAFSSFLPSIEQVRHGSLDRRTLTQGYIVGSVVTMGVAALVAQQADTTDTLLVGIALIGGLVGLYEYFYRSQ